MGGLSLGWNLTKSAFWLSIEFRILDGGAWLHQQLIFEALLLLQDDTLYCSHLTLNLVTLYNPNPWKFQKS